LSPDPPHAREAEAARRGAGLLGARDLALRLAQVAPTDFYEPRNEASWQAVAEVHRMGQTPDAITVSNAARTSGSRGVDPMVLFDLAQAAPIAIQAPHYAQIVTTAAGLRALSSAAIAIGQIASTPGDLEEKREEARARLDEAARGRHISKARRVADLLPATIEAAETGHADV